MTEAAVSYTHLTLPTSSRGVGDVYKRQDELPSVFSNAEGITFVMLPWARSGVDDRSSIKRGLGDIMRGLLGDEVRGGRGCLALRRQNVTRDRPPRTDARTCILGGSSRRLVSRTQGPYGLLSQFGCPLRFHWESRFPFPDARAH